MSYSIGYIVNISVKRVICLRCIAPHSTSTLAIPQLIEQGCKHFVMFLLQRLKHFTALRPHKYMADPLDAINIKTIYRVFMLNFIPSGKIYCDIGHVGKTDY